MYSICDAFKNRTQLNGATITVRGVYFSNELGEFLVDERPYSENFECLLGPIAMSLVTPTDLDERGNSIPNEVHRRIRREVTQLAEGRRPGELDLIITVTGEFEGVSTFETQRYPPPTLPTGNGLGDGGMFPTQITVRKVEHHSYRKRRS